jgi:integrase/recombinase XerD
MTRSTGQRKHHLKDVQPSDPAVVRISAWPPANQTFYQRFRRWLQEGGYGDSSLHLYGCAARLALGWLDKPYWEIDSQADIDRVRAYIAGRYDSQATRDTYNKGLKKLAEFLTIVCRNAPSQKPIRWSTYIGSLPAWLGDEVRAYVKHRRRNWPPEMQHRATLTCLSQLTLSLRWMAALAELSSADVISPALWYDYVDDRLAESRSPTTLNTHLSAVQSFLRFLTARGHAICEGMMCLELLTEEEHLPRDVPVAQLRRLQREIEALTASAHAGERRQGRMDLAWYLLMLHCGLRTGEVRALRRAALDLDDRRIRIEQSKGLKDRAIYASAPAAEALRAYLDVRGDAPTDHVFVYRHKPLSSRYCGIRLDTYGRRCDVRITPHQLRHSFSTLLLNAGAPIETLQKLLGHAKIDTTLIYSRVYDSTVAADYYRAIGQIEGQPEGTLDQPIDGEELLALVDVLQSGTLDEVQQEAVQALRVAIQVLDLNRAPNKEDNGPVAEVI